jgi:iron complex transport system permease protein
MTERPRRVLAFAALLAGVPLALLLASALGAVPLSPLGVLRALLAWGTHLGPADGGLGETGAMILWSVRLPRVLLAALVGGGLAVVGAALQSVFRNPLADAGLLGVGPGAAFGAVLAIHLGWSASVFLALPAAAFAGAMLATAAVYLLAHIAGRPTLAGLLLTGVAVGSLATAGLSIVLVATDEYRVKTVLFWLAGGLEGRTWPHVQSAAVLIGAGMMALVALSRVLDVLSLGEIEAASLGLRVRLARLVILGLSAIVAGAATSTAGSVPFIGLIAPHALRPIVGPRGRHLLPATFLAGALIVVLADLATRTLSLRMDLPLGSLTTLVGAPYFLLALRGNRGRP